MYTSVLYIYTKDTTPTWTPVSSLIDTRIYTHTRTHKLCREPSPIFKRSPWHRSHSASSENTSRWKHARTHTHAEDSATTTSSSALYIKTESSDHHDAAEADLVRSKQTNKHTNVYSPSLAAKSLVWSLSLSLSLSLCLFVRSLALTLAKLQKPIAN